MSVSDLSRGTETFALAIVAREGAAQARCEWASQHSKGRHIETRRGIAPEDSHFAVSVLGTARTDSQISEAVAVAVRHTSDAADASR